MLKVNARLKQHVQIEYLNISYRFGGDVMND